MTRTPDLSSPEAYHADIVANAVKFTASLSLGQGKYDNREAPTFAEIEVAAKELAAAHPDIRAKPLIMAFNAAGANVVIGKEYESAKVRRERAKAARRG